MKANRTVVSAQIELESEANKHEHWAAKSRRARTQKGIVKAELGCVIFDGKDDGGNYRIVLTRVKRKFQRNYDGDNLQRAFKAVRDAVADALGIDDGSNRLEWLYRQAKGNCDRGYVTMEIERVR